MAQFLRPDGNVTQSGFTNGASAIAEATASDADFAWGANHTAAVLEVSLGNPGSTPGSGTCTVRYRIARTDDGVVDGGGNSVAVTGELYQGTSQVAADTARTATGSWTTYSFTFAASAVSDWTDLRFRATTTASGGSGPNRRGGAVSWAEVEVPDGAPPVGGSGSGTVAHGGTGSGAEVFAGGGSGASAHGGSGTGHETMAGAGAGSASHAGTGAGWMAAVGSGSGRVTHRGAGAGSAGGGAVSGAGTGSAAHAGTGVGVEVFAGGGAGSAAHGGSGAAGEWFVGAGGGAVAHTGTGTGAAVQSVMGVGAGVATHQGSGSGRGGVGSGGGCGCYPRLRWRR